MLLHRTILLILWMSFAFAGVVQSAIDSEECRSETNALIANSEALAESYPSNVTCTFLNDTYCSIDFFHITKDYTRHCYEADGRVVYYTTQGNYDTEEENKTVSVLISNDPVCVSSNCSIEDATFPYDRLDALPNDSALFTFESSPMLYTSFTGMCALDTLELQEALPQVIMPYQKCNSSSCIMNYTAPAEIFASMCRGKGGDAVRQTERMATCRQDASDAESAAIAQINVPYCFSAQCSMTDIAEEQMFLDEQWHQPIGLEFAYCSFSYGAWETVNASTTGTTNSSGDNSTSNGGSGFDYQLWQWITLFAIWMTPFMTVE